MNNSALKQILRGLYIIGARDGEWFCGCLVSDVFQGGETGLVVNLVRNSHTGECLKVGYNSKNNHSEFSISVLPHDIDPMIITNFDSQSIKDTEKWQTINYTLFNELPIVPNCCAYFHCKLEGAVGYSLFPQFPKHTIFHSKILASEVRRREPMTYKYYLENIKK